LDAKRFPRAETSTALRDLVQRVTGDIQHEWRRCTLPRTSTRRFPRPSTRCRRSLCPEAATQSSLC